VNLQLLIDSIVRQTTVLIAQLATAQGVRAPLAHVADQVFLDLARELEAQGVSRKVSADMFGLALRTYQRKVQRLGESVTDRGQSLWEAVLGFLNDSGGVVARAEVLRRFHRDDPELVRGVLHDLTESGLVFSIGSRSETAYRVATGDEIGAVRHVLDETGSDELVWAIVYREGPLTRQDLAKLLRNHGPDPALERLIAGGRVQRSDDTEPLYSARQFFVPRDASSGWEAAVFDHFQALVKTIAQRLATRAPPNPNSVGGSTYSFEIWPGHPLEAEVLSWLESLRIRTSELRAAIGAHNAENARPPNYFEVTVYAGQCVTVQNETGDP
jgi:hypothetical protein